MSLGTHIFFSVFKIEALWLVVCRTDDDDDDGWRLLSVHLLLTFFAFDGKGKQFDPDRLSSRQGRRWRKHRRLNNITHVPWVC